MFGFLRMGTVALTAQALGAGDAVEQRAVPMRALLIAAVVGLLLLALQIPIAAAVYGLIGGSDAVRAAARQVTFSSASGRRPSRSPISPCSAG